MLEWTAVMVALGRLRSATLAFFRVVARTAGWAHVSVLLESDSGPPHPSRTQGELTHHIEQAHAPLSDCVLHVELLGGS